MTGEKIKWQDAIMSSNVDHRRAKMAFICHSQEAKTGSRHCQRRHVVVKGRLLPSGVDSDESGVRE
jgi:hypothetical protein